MRKHDSTATLERVAHISTSLLAWSERFFFPVPATVAEVSVSQVSPRE